MPLVLEDENTEMRFRVVVRAYIIPILSMGMGMVIGQRWGTRTIDESGRQASCECGACGGGMECGLRIIDGVHACR